MWDGCFHFFVVFSSVQLPSLMRTCWSGWTSSSLPFSPWNVSWRSSLLVCWWEILKHTQHSVWILVSFTPDTSLDKIIIDKKTSEVQAWNSIRHQRPHSEISYMGLKYRNSVLSVYTFDITTDLSAIQTGAWKWRLPKREACLGYTHFWPSFFLQYKYSWKKTTEDFWGYLIVTSLYSLQEFFVGIFTPETVLI